MKRPTLVFTLLCVMLTFANAVRSQNDTPLIIRQCADFTITGKGDHPEWQKTKWVALVQLDKSGNELETKFKIMYSSRGLYVVFSGQDQKITSPFTKDYETLYKGDVFEVFFHPIPSEPVYFEYEVSPLNKELVLLISNRKGRFGRWIPWQSEENKVIKKVNITGGTMSDGSTIQAWTAELFFPYDLLNLFSNVPPKSGMRWNANFCRLDYDGGKMVKWSWSPIKVSFHEFDKYFPVQFE